MPAGYAASHPKLVVALLAPVYGLHLSNCSWTYKDTGPLWECWKILEECVPSDEVEVILVLTYGCSTICSMVNERVLK